MGAPRFSWITRIFAWNGAGAGGGATRLTTARLTMAAGGRGAGRAPATAMARRDAAVGMIGTVPRTAGAETTCRTICGSRTKLFEIRAPEPKVFWLTTVT